MWLMVAVETRASGLSMA